jgi:hypothetical protein
MVATVGSIAIDLSANTAKFTHGFKSAATTVERESARMSKAVAGMGGVIGGLAGVGAFAALTSLTGALTKARESLTKFEDIGNVARLVGLTAKSFQELSFAALETDVSQETLNTSLQIFAKNAGLANEGTGALYSGLLKLNPELLRAVLSTEDQEERLRLVADAMSRMTSATEKAALATAVFGRGGIDMVRMLEGGSAALDAFAARAAELGIIVSDEDIRRFGAAADEIERLAFVTDQNLSIALANAAPLLIKMGEAALWLSQQLNEAQGQVSELGRVTNDFINNPSVQNFLEMMFGAGAGGMSEMAARAAQSNADAGAAIDNMLAGMGSGGGGATAGGLPRVTSYGGGESTAAEIARLTAGEEQRWGVHRSLLEDGTSATTDVGDDVDEAAKTISGAVESSGYYIAGRFDDMARALAPTQSQRLAAGSAGDVGDFSYSGNQLGGSGSTSWAGRQFTIGGGGSSYGSDGGDPLIEGLYNLLGASMPSTTTAIAESGDAAINVNVVVKPVLEGQRLSAQSTAEIKQAAAAGANAALRAYNGR